MPVSGTVALHACERLPALDRIAPADAADAFRDLPGLTLLESARPGRAGRWSFLVAEPVAVLEGSTPGVDPFAEARAALARLDATPLPPGAPPFAGGLVGHLGYDLGRRLERLPVRAIDDQKLPDLRLGLHAWAIAWDGHDGRAWLAGRAVDGDLAGLERALAGARARAEAAVRVPLRGEPVFPRLVFRSDVDRATWMVRVEAVRAAIAAGELYQANLTRRLVAPFDGEPWSIFRRLRAGEASAFTAFVDLGRASPADPRRAIVSASPEPFLALDAAGRVRTDPIKGTRPRGRTRTDDRALASQLLASGKDRAENTMIVDVLRNDLGRVCRPGSVRVPRLWRLERTPSVQHLVSTVTGWLTPGRDAFHLLAATFPGGSITGAPKIRAMELIESLEPVRRGPYCGAALWLDAGGAMGSSILIRTFVADGRRLTLHVGGGVTWRSDPAAEWEETRTKARGPLRAIGASVEGEEAP
ncbi:MAG TPA: anthranilate synthase component I family protein [Candidatus Nanopelagicales bacterium]|nr:anthranilate synthase component I family protein [Candidatus Nanopelagicales bacterium]